MLFLFCLDSLCASQQFFSHVGMAVPGLNQNKAADKVSCSRTQHRDLAGIETQTSNMSVPRLTIYQLSHWAALKMLCISVGGAEEWGDLQWTFGEL